jgi:hypothetical protein
MALTCVGVALFVQTNQVEEASARQAPQAVAVNELLAIEDFQGPDQQHFGLSAIGRVPLVEQRQSQVRHDLAGQDVVVPEDLAMPHQSLAKERFGLVELALPPERLGLSPKESGTFRVVVDLVVGRRAEEFGRVITAADSEGSPVRRESQRRDAPFVGL